MSTHKPPYATLGPPIPEEGLPDEPPLAILGLQEVSESNGLGEVIFLADVGVLPQRVHAKLILACVPQTGEIKRAAVCLAPGTGAGFVATDPGQLPGNLIDLIRTILTDPCE